MSSIDERIVKMRLDNSQFEQGVNKTSGLLSKLKSALNLDKSVESINNVDKAVNRVNFKPITSGLQGVQSGFNAMGAVAFSVFNRMTNAAIDAGQRITSSLTAAVRDGFAEYETQMGSVQTILSNTMSKGTNLDQVNTALDTLNTYADKTIYNFTEMTKNIGTFTAAGVDLQTSVDSIKGIANLAAASGSTSAQAASAMYQLSQALAAGKIQLMDWNSVVNAGMGGELFQNALKRTAGHFGTDVDALIKEYGSFRESLSKGDWLTADVLTETLKQISGAYSEADLIEQGYTEQQAKDITNLANTANDAATKVKTFTQLIDTTKEALGSGWTQSWEIIIGDFEESKDLWTGISDQINNIVNTSANARNELLSSGLSSGWKQLLSQGIADTAGFQDIMTQTARDHGIAIDDMIAKNGSFTKSMHEGWVTADIVTESVQKMTDKMSSMSQKELQASGYTSENVEQIKKLNEQLQNGSLSAQDFADKMNRMSGRENIISGLNNVFSDLSKVFERIGKSYREVFPKMTGDELYTLTKRFKDFTDKLAPSEEALNNIDHITKSVFSSIKYVFGDLLKIFKQIGKAYKETFSNNIEHGLFTLNVLTARLNNFIKALTPSETALNRIGRIAKGVFSSINDVFGDLLKIFKQIGKAYKETFSNNIEHGLFTLTVLTARLKNFIKTLTPSEETLNKIGRIAKGVFAVFDIGVQVVKAVGDNIAAAFGSVNMSGPIDNLLDIAARFGDWLVRLDESIKRLGIFDAVAKKVRTAITGVINAFNSFIEKFSSVGSTAKSISSKMGDIIEKAFERIKTVVGDTATWIKDHISIGDIFTGLVGGTTFLTVKKIGETFDKIKETIDNLFGKGGDTLKKGAGAFEDVLSGLSDSLNEFTKNIKVASLLEISGAIALLVNSMERIAALKGGEVVRGITTIGILMTELDLNLKAISKSMKSVKTSDLVKTGLALIEFAKSVEMLANAMDKIGKLNWEEIGKGLSGMAGAMIELTLVSKALGRSKVNVRTATSLIATAMAVKMVAKPLAKLGSMKWEDIGKGLSAMGGALVEMSTVTGLLSRFGKNNISAAVSMVITAKSLDDIADAFDSFANHSWEDIGKGLTAMGGALTEVGLITGALGKIAGFSGLLGAGTILLAAHGLDNIASAFDSFADHSWEEIGKGLTAMGGALTEVSLMSGALGKIAGFSGLLGAGTILLAAHGLGDLASAFDSFANHSWEEIGKGLTAMGGAMTEVAVISGATGALTGIAGLVGAGTIVLAVQGLKDLASGFDSFADHSWEEIGKGLTAMGGAMTEVAVISGATGALTGIAGLAGAGTIALASQGLTDLATAFGKFGEYNWDEIGRGLTAMGAAMGETALGGLLNTLSGFGAGAISEMAEPLGTLADSVKKWEDVSVPSDLAIQLGQIADGVMKFTLDGLGGATIADIAQPIGVLADSLSKWSTITFPEGISEQLSSLSKGVQSFTWAFAGGWSIGSVVEPLGQLADSVNKWKGVYVPVGIDTGLESLSKGVQSFTWAFVGAWSIEDTVEPLSKLADAVRNWKGVYVPVGIDTGLESLSKGVQSFTWAFVGGWSLNAVTGPLGDLGDAVRKWNGIKIPDGIYTSMKEFADGVKEFKGIGSDVYDNLFNVKINILGLYNALLAFKQIDLPETANSILSFVCSLNSMPAVTSKLPDQVSDFTTKLGTSLNSLESTVSSNSNAIGSSFLSLRAQATSAISGLGSAVASNMNLASNAVFAGANMISSGSNAIGSAFGRMASIARSQLAIFSNTVSSSLDKAVSVVRSSAPIFRFAGTQIVMSLTDSLKSGLNQIPNMFNSTISSATSNIRSFRSSFYSAGVYVADGFASGISSQIDTAAIAAAQLAKAASEAAKDALDIHSPSKVFGWIGEMTVDGFTNKVDGMETDVRKSGYGMAESVIKGFNDLDVSSIPDPSIRPVMDLSIIRRQASSLSSMLSTSTNPIKADIDYIGRLESQNGADYQTKMLDRLISATDKNAKELSDLRGDISRYNESISGQETAVYVDGKKLASSIAKPMNQQLGIRSRRGSLSRL